MVDNRRSPSAHDLCALVKKTHVPLHCQPQQASVQSAELIFVRLLLNPERQKVNVEQPVFFYTRAHLEIS